MKNLTRCFSLDVAGRVDVLQARYYGHALSPHWHEEYAIGLITGAWNSSNTEELRTALALERSSCWMLVRSILENHGMNGASRSECCISRKAHFVKRQRAPGVQVGR